MPAEAQAPPCPLRLLDALAARPRWVVLLAAGRHFPGTHQNEPIIDNGWAALFAWLNGWCLLPLEKNPRQGEMLAVRDLVFGQTGLQFTQLPYKLEWHESKTRLDVLARDGNDKAIAKLGGAPFLDHLNEAQETYGKVLGIT